MPPKMWKPSDPQILFGIENCGLQVHDTSFKLLSLHGMEFTSFSCDSKFQLMNITDSYVQMRGITVQNSLSDIGGAFSVQRTASSGDSQTANLALIESNLKKCESKLSGGAIHATSNALVSLQNVVVSDNKAGTNGGGIHLNSARFTMDGLSYVRENYAADGGGMYIENGATLAGGNIEKNTAMSIGGNVLTNGAVEINNVKILRGEAFNGGGISMTPNSQLTIKKSTLANNNAKNKGGGISSIRARIIFEDTIIQECTAKLGGGLFLDGDSTLSGTSQIISNKATENGGGMYLNVGIFSISNSIIVKNDAVNYGGAIYSLAPSSISLQNNEIKENTANYGGGFSASTSKGDVEIGSQGTNIIQKNYGNVAGGNFHISAPPEASCFKSSLKNLEITGGVAPRGGGVYISSCTSKLEKCSVKK